MNWGTKEKGTNEMGDQWDGGPMSRGDQWNEWCMGANWGINEMGDQWDGGPMRWGTNEMGDQWDGGPMMCTKKTHSIATITQIRSLELLTAKLLYCKCYTIWIDWHVIFGLEQEGGTLIAPMALAHPLHPIDNRSRAIFTNSLDLRLDSRLGLDPDRVSSETRSGSKSSPIHKGKSSRLDWVATKVMT